MGKAPSQTGKDERRIGWKKTKQLRLFCQNVVAEEIGQGKAIIQRKTAKLKVSLRKKAGKFMAK